MSIDMIAIMSAKRELFCYLVLCHEATHSSEAGVTTETDPLSEAAMATETNHQEVEPQEGNSLPMSVVACENVPQNKKKSMQKKTKKRSRKDRKGQKRDKKTNQEHYKIEAVKEIRRINGRLEFLVKWAGYSEMLNSWEPEEHFQKEDIEAFTRNFHV